MQQQGNTNGASVSASKQKRAANLIGKRFGRLTAIAPAEKYVKGKCVSNQWLCQCDCGQTRVVRANYLLSGGYRSCGCLKQRSDLAGARVGRLSVIDFDKDKGWRCICDCGLTCFCSNGGLVRKLTKACPSCVKNAARLDLIGMRFGNMTVIASARKESVASSKAYWLCKCDCGREHITRTDYLRNGRAKSCGCFFRDLTARKLRGLWRAVYKHHRWQAQTRGIETALSEDEFISLSKQACHYCGIPPVQRRVWRKAKIENRVLDFNGLDRLDSNLGYVAGNVVPACKFCNVAKHTMSYQEFKSWVARVHHHLFKSERKPSSNTQQLSLVS